MYYAIYCEDVPNSLELRRSVRSAHIKRLEQLQQTGKLLAAGPILHQDNENPFVGGIKGSLIIAEFDNLEQAKAWAAADPYTTAKVYKRVNVEPFKKVLPVEED